MLDCGNSCGGFDWRFGNFVAFPVFPVDAEAAVPLIFAGDFGIAGVRFMKTICREAVFDKMAELFNNLEDVVLEGGRLEDLNVSLFIVCLAFIVELTLEDDEFDMNLPEGNVLSLTVCCLVE